MKHRFCDICGRELHWNAPEKKWYEDETLCEVCKVRRREKNDNT